MRLIDADALQNILLPITTALEHEYGSLGGAVSGCMKHIDNAPTVDAVPVVKCRECKNYVIVDEFEGGKRYMCLVNHFSYLDNDGDNQFCSYGERKEGADNETRKCAFCGKEFTVNKYAVTKCCSRSCARRLRSIKQRETAGQTARL